MVFSSRMRLYGCTVVACSFWQALSLRWSWKVLRRFWWMWCQLRPRQQQAQVPRPGSAVHTHRQTSPYVGVSLEAVPHCFHICNLETPSTTSFVNGHNVLTELGQPGRNTCKCLHAPPAQTMAHARRGCGARGGLGSQGPRCLADLRPWAEKGERANCS